MNDHYSKFRLSFLHAIILHSYAILFFKFVFLGLGKVNEKLRNGEDLSTNDFKSLDDSSVHEDAQHDKNKQNSLEVKKTPILIKSQSNANHSPSLFSPLPQNLELQKGIFCLG
jgi:hypothetical protein